MSARAGRLFAALLTIALLAPSTPAGSVSAPSVQDAGAGHRRRDPLGAEFVPGELLVAFRESVPASERARARAAHGLRFLEKVPLPGLEKVALADGADVEEAAARVSRDPRVRYAEPNYLMRPSLTPNDPEFGEQWGLHNTGQTGGTNDADIDAPAAWDIASDTSGVIVGVIDTGVKFDHPDLAANMWVNPGESGGGKETNGIDDDGNGFIDDVHGWDFFNDDATVFDLDDGDDHGTHVAGTISAVIDNATDVAGVSEAQIMALKFLGPGGGSISDAIAAIDYAIDNGAHLTNNSWGGSGNSTPLKEKIAEAGDAGQLFVVAAGNSGNDIDSDPEFPAAFDLDNIISVAATNHNDGLAGFSNFGDVGVDLGAPGVSILSTVPRFDKAVLVGPDVGSSGEHTIAYHTFGLEGVIGSSDRNALMDAAIGRTGIGSSDPILLVDDDAGSDMEDYYEAALSALGFTSVTTTPQVPGPTGPPINPSCSDGPSASTLAAHDLVIWFTGADFVCTLTSTDRSNLTTYLGGGAGRNLLLFGQDIGFDITNDGSTASAFMEDVLRARYIIDLDVNFRLSGVSSTPYSTLDLDLDPRNPSDAGPDEGQLFSSGVRALSGAKAGLRGARTTWFDGTSMATPHVSGAIAQMTAAFPAAGHLALKCRLLATTDPKPSLGGKTVSGGRLNLHRALDPSVPGCFSLALDPEEAARVVGESHTVTANVTDPSGDPAPNGTLIEFETSGTGAESPSSGSDTTSGGVATFSFTSTKTGLSTISAEVSGEISGATASVTWLPGPPASLTLTPSSDTNVVLSEHAVNATVRDTYGNLVADGTSVSFTASGTGKESPPDAFETTSDGVAPYRFTSTRIGTSTISATSGSASDTASKIWVCPSGVASPFFAYSSAFTGGIYVASGDVDGDGCDEIITGAGRGGGPLVRVFSGRTGQPIASFFAYSTGFTGGVRVAAGDINGDGKDEIITGVGSGGGPHLKVFSGDGKTTLRSFLAYAPGFTGGLYVAGGDVNGDGFDDVITGVGGGGGPHVKVFSKGSPSSVIRSFMAYSTTFNGGVRVGAGHFNSGTKADIITGVGSGGGPHLKVFSGHDLSLLRSFMAYDPSFRGGLYVAGGDVNGGGDDIITGVGSGGGPHVKVFSKGTSSSVIRSFMAYSSAFSGGVRVSGAQIHGVADGYVLTGPGPGGGPLIRLFP